MQIVLVDDDADTLAVTKALLLTLGHAVLDFTDAIAAVDSMLETRADLIISDIRMPALDGFDVARKVAEGLGVSPPRCLLVSGSGEEDEYLQTLPPSLIIGVLLKPFYRLDLSNVVSLLDKSRSRCPGIVAPLCLYAPDDPPSSANGLSTPCASPDYAVCPHYDAHCGKMLRLWITTHNCGA